MSEFQSIFQSCSTITVGFMKSAHRFMCSMSSIYLFRRLNLGAVCLLLPASFLLSTLSINTDKIIITEYTHRHMFPADVHVLADKSPRNFVSFDTLMSFIMTWSSFANANDRFWDRGPCADSLLEKHSWTRMSVLDYNFLLRFLWRKQMQQMQCNTVMRTMTPVNTVYLHNGIIRSFPTTF